MTRERFYIRRRISSFVVDGDAERRAGTGGNLHFVGRRGGERRKRGKREDKKGCGSRDRTTHDDLRWLATSLLTPAAAKRGQQRRIFAAHRHAHGEFHHVVRIRANLAIGFICPGRQNIVVTRNVAYRAEGAVVVGSLPAALAAAASDEAFVIGGAELYQAALPLAGRLQLTEIDADYAGDTWFPPRDPQEWRETARDAQRDETGLGYAFVTCERT